MKQEGKRKDEGTKKQGLEKGNPKLKQGSQIIRRGLTGGGRSPEVSAFKTKIIVRTRRSPWQKEKPVQEGKPFLKKRKKPGKKS